MTIIPGIPDEIPEHSAHRPGHKLKLLTADGRSFTCDGCMEPGTDTWYRCEHEGCNFDLHTCCAAAPTSLVHPLLGRHAFVLHRKPPGGGRVCDACGDPVCGFVYHRERDGQDLHPCCARLEDIVQGGRVFELRQEASRECGVCGRNGGRRSRFWAFRSRFGGEDVDIHVACMKKVARLSWEASYRNRVGGGQIVQVRGLTADDVLQSLSSQTRTTSGFRRFFEIVGVVLNIIVAAIFGNPVAMIAAIAGPGGLLRG